MSTVNTDHAVVNTVAPPLPKRSRVVSRPNPEQQITQEIPRLVTDAERDSMSATVEQDMRSLGFMERHIFEAKQFLQAYVRASQGWHESYEKLQEDEREDGGFTARAYEFMEDCRKVGGRFKTPRYLDAKGLEAVYLTSLSHSHRTTKKLTGGIFALIVAIVIKTYLLIPLSVILLTPVMGRGESPTKFVLAIPLAAALSYGITFMVRFCMMLLASIAPGETFKQVRTSGQLFSKPITYSLLGFMAVALLGTMVSFVVMDYIQLGSRQELMSPFWAVSGLAMMFFGTVIAYEFFVAYQTLRHQQEPEAADKATLRNAYLKAVDRYHDEVALAQGRTLALHMQEAWHTLMAQLDAVKPDSSKAPVQRARALQTIRGVATDFRDMGAKASTKRPYLK